MRGTLVALLLGSASLSSLNLQEIHSYWQVEIPIPDEKGLLFIARAPEDEQAKLWRLCDEPELVVDPGLNSFAGVLPYGDQVAYGLQTQGSDWETWHVGEDRLEWIKFGQICWGPQGEGLYYLRKPTPPPGEELTAPNGLGGMIYFHRLGTPQAADELLYADEAIGGIVLAPGDKELWIWLSETSVLALNLESHEVYEIAPPDSDEDEMVVESVEVGDYLVVSSLENAVAQLCIYKEGVAREIELPGQGMVSAAWQSMHLVGYGEDEFFFAYADMATPKQIYRCDLETGKISPFAERNLAWDPADFVMEQIWVEDVPVFVGRKIGTQENAPTLLYAYGGFGVVMGPFFDPMHLAWMDEGGIVAIACVRGGGELGEEWREAARRERKQCTFDDFFAVAEHFSDRPLGIYGRSNGGLLVGAAITQHPELFDAAVGGVGVYDMLDFHKWTVGQSWEDEYGSPEDPEAREWLQAYSPLHNVRPDIPPLLLLTGTHDDRVVPIHTYRFAEALEALGAPVEVHVNEFGHSPTHFTKSAQIEEEQVILDFFRRELGL